MLIAGSWLASSYKGCARTYKNLYNKSFLFHRNVILLNVILKYYHVIKVPNAIRIIIFTIRLHLLELSVKLPSIKAGLYRILCGVHTLDDSGVNRLGDTSAFVNPAGQLLLSRRVNS